MLNNKQKSNSKSRDWGANLSESLSGGPQWRAYRGRKYKNIAFSLLATLFLHCPMKFRQEGKFSGPLVTCFLMPHSLSIGKKWFRQGDNPMKTDVEMQNYI